MWENILVLLAVVFFLWLFNIPIGRSKKTKPRRTNRKTVRSPSPVRQDEGRLELAHLLPPESEQAARNFDWDSARAELQKVAYAMAGKGVPPQQKDEFRLFMARFALHDPLYLEVMARLKPLLKDEPGLVQSQLYKDEAEYTKMMMRYVLYFAEVLGHVRRVKKGNSYRLYLPDQSITE